MKRVARVIVGIAVLACAACTVDKTEEGKLPDVDVNADSARLPQYNVEPANVEIGTDTNTVVTPSVDVKPQKN